MLTETGAYLKVEKMRWALGVFTECGIQVHQSCLSTHLLQHAPGHDSHSVHQSFRGRRLARNAVQALCHPIVQLIPVLVVFRPNPLSPILFRREAQSTLMEVVFRENDRNDPSRDTGVVIVVFSTVQPNRIWMLIAVVSVYCRRKVVAILDRRESVARKCIQAPSAHTSAAQVLMVGVSGGCHMNIP
jgi:hypothetical protein